MTALRASFSGLLDPGELDVLRSRSGVLVARGSVQGVPAVVYQVDGPDDWHHVVEAVELAMRECAPVIGVWRSGEPLEGMGPVLSAMARASGRIPQISVLAGPDAGRVAHGVALTDVVIMIAEPGAPGRAPGVVHVVVDDDVKAFRHARRMTGLLARPGRVNPDSVAGYQDLASVAPPAHGSYDVRPLVRTVLDTGTFCELQDAWATSIVTGLGRLGGGAVGVIANNPARARGRLDRPSAEKAARLVRTCDEFGLPLLVVVDVPGSLPGVEEGWSETMRRGAVLLSAFAESRVPRVALVTRKAYSGAYDTVNACSLGATAVCAWPGAAGGAADEVIDPRRTRAELARVLSTATLAGGPHWTVTL